MQKLTKIIIAAVIFMVLFAGHGMAATASLVLADWSEASPLGGVAGISGAGSYIMYSGWYYTDVETVNGYLKFDLSSLTPPSGHIFVVNSATLTIWTAAQVGEEFSNDLYAVADDAWTNTSVNNTNKPAMGSLLGTALSPGPYMSITYNASELAAYVQQEGNGDKTASLGLKAGADCVFVSSTNPFHLLYMGTSQSQWFATILAVDYSFETNPVDFNADGIVNFKDLAMFAQEWLTCIDPENANCEHPW